MIIEGDNVEVLKLVQESYLGKVKMIYMEHFETLGVPLDVVVTADEVRTVLMER
ncbi:MAG TPA: hypothetical protein VNL18_02590 [Gemmatimonadales bacterium]|nr:hypothetical protein [Gemmatimonadales bacterium]